MAFSSYYKTRKVSGIGRRLNEVFAAAVAAEVKRNSRDGDAVLEVGPGEGGIADRLVPSLRYCVYEASPVLASGLREKGIEVREAFAPPFTEETATQNVVLATHVLEHMAGHFEARLLFTEAARVLVPGGVLIIVSPDFNDMGKLFFDVDYSHSFATTPNRLVQLAKDASLIVIKKRFLYGALPVFPGIICNLLVKLFFYILRPFKENTMFEYKGIFKLEYMFARAVYVVFQKPINFTEAKQD
ncbi:MAG TPA: methyltransferase domain-containing protein [Chitinivibrionales bacterium]|nr:methyltransferase domain-containing protein [Chitinivibrionales bacterium]